MNVSVQELRELIVGAAPDPDLARPVADCAADAVLDHVIPFSSIIVLGVVVAIEDRYGVRVTRDMLVRACAGGVTLDKLAEMIRTSKEPTG
jgi:hypothetical protein